jgi:hypothetical protein
MLVSLGYEGSSSWLTGDLQTLYGNRHDLLAVVKSNAAAGRAAAFYTTDEHIQIYLNYNRSPFHVLGMITPTGKLGVYSYWKPGTTEMAADGHQLEFYDYTAPNGRLELNNQPNAPGAQSMYSQLINQYLASEIQAPMPTSLGPVARQSRQNYLSFVSLVEALTESGALQNIGLFFGADAL